MSIWRRHKLRTGGVVRRDGMVLVGGMQPPGTPPPPPISKSVPPPPPQAPRVPELHVHVTLSDGMTGADIVAAIERATRRGRGLT